MSQSRSAPAGAIAFRAIAMLDEAYAGCMLRVRDQGLRWSSRPAAFGSEVFLVRDTATSAQVTFTIGRHLQRRGRIDAATPAQRSIVDRLAAARVLFVEAARASQGA